MWWTDLADLVGGLPPGCAFWREVGGPQALSMEVHAILAVKYGADILAWQNTGMMRGKPRGSQPKPPPDPPYAAEVAAQQERAESKRERFLARAERRRTNEG